MVQGDITIHPCEILLICPAEACHAPILNRSSAIVTLIYPAPDGILGLVGKVLGAVVARLIATVACADGLIHDLSDAARAWGASAGILLVTDADIVVLLLAVGADVRQNNRNHLTLRAPAVGSRRRVARVALVAIVGPENGGPNIPAVRAAAPVFTAGIACRAEFACHVGAVGLMAEVDVHVREGHLIVIRSV